MATLSEIRSLGDTVSVFSSPIAEPLNAPMRFEDRLQRFGEHYNTGHDSHLYRFLLSLCGDAGAGTLKREKLYPRLQQILGSTYFQDLDKLYGNPLGISRLPKELYIYDPHHEALTQQQWTEVFAKDAAYRERCLTWMRAIIEGPTPKGIALAAEAACGFECDIFENYKYIDNAPLNRTGQILIGGTGSAGFLKRSLIINDQSRLDNIEGDGLPATQSSFGA